MECCEGGGDGKTMLTFCCRRRLGFAISHRGIKGRVGSGKQSAAGGASTAYGGVKMWISPAGDFRRCCVPSHGMVQFQHVNERRECDSGTPKGHLARGSEGNMNTAGRFRPKSTSFPDNQTQTGGKEERDSG